MSKQKTTVRPQNFQFGKLGWNEKTKSFTWEINAAGVRAVRQFAQAQKISFEKSGQILMNRIGRGLQNALKAKCDAIRAQFLTPTSPTAR